MSQEDKDQWKILTPHPELIDADASTHKELGPLIAQDDTIEKQAILDEDQQRCCDEPTNVTPLATTFGTIRNRDWSGAILSICTVNIFMALLMQLLELTQQGDLPSYVQLIKLNLLSILGFVTGGVWSQWASLDKFSWFFASLGLYWALVVIYPMIIFLGKDDGSLFTWQKDRQSKLKESILVTLGLILFFPFGCLRSLRLLISKQDRQRCESIDNLPYFKLLPEILATSCELFFVFQVVQYTMIGLTVGPMRLSYNDWFSNCWVIPLAQILWALVFSVFLVARRRR